jgi:hypothetical protein
MLEEGEVGSVHQIYYRRWEEDGDKTVAVDPQGHPLAPAIDLARPPGA